MANRLELIAGRTNLESVLKKASVPNPNIELGIYDFLFKSRIDFIDVTENEMYEIVDEALDVDPIGKGRLTARELIAAKMMGWRKRRGHDPAYIIGLNYGTDETHESHRIAGVAHFSGKNVLDRSHDFNEYLNEIGFKDGAVLFDDKGDLKYARVIFGNVSADDIPNINSSEETDHFRQFGFREWVNARHFASIGASYHLKGLTVYSLSEESGNIRRYVNGKITFSTHDEERFIIDYPVPIQE